MIDEQINLENFNRRIMKMSSLSNFPLFMQELIDLFYKISMIIALFYATKALRIYIDKNMKK